MKKTSIGILSLALVCGLGLTACNSASKNNNSKDMGSVIKTKEEVYAYSMFSSSSLLSNLNTSVSPLANEVSEDKAVTEEEIKKINDYVEMFEGLLSSKGIDQVTEENKDEGFLDYETKVTVKENGITYVSYLNEEALNEEDKDKDEDEEEYSTLLNGLMFELDAQGNIKEDASYIVEGNKTIENEVEEDEQESELEITMTSYLAEKDVDGKYTKVMGAKSVTVTQELETEVEGNNTETEQSFTYTVKDGNGNIIEDECSEVEIEEEKGEVEISLTLGHNEDTAKIYEFTKNGDVLEVEVYEGEDNLIEEIKITTVINEDGTKKNVYEFKDGSKLEEDDD